jgi:hypothetical protein
MGRRAYTGKDYPVKIILYHSLTPVFKTQKRDCLPVGTALSRCLKLRKTNIDGTLQMWLSAA